MLGCLWGVRGVMEEGIECCGSGGGTLKGVFGKRRGA